MEDPFHPFFPTLFSVALCPRNKAEKSERKHTRLREKENDRAHIPTHIHSIKIVFEDNDDDDDDDDDTSVHVK